jgi:phage protein U
MIDKELGPLLLMESQRKKYYDVEQEQMKLTKGFGNISGMYTVEIVETILENRDSSNMKRKYC